MRYVVIMAGGSGTRLWPMSRSELPKQLIPFIEGRSLLEIAYDRFEGLIPADRRYVCAGQRHRDVILSGVPALDASRFLGEPTGRDTLAAAGFSAAVLAAIDPEAVIGVFTADQLIEPTDEFQRIISQGFDLIERHPEMLVTFGIAPTNPSTGFGYLALGPEIDGMARTVKQFREKPPRKIAEEYFQAGPQRFLWNSGMFVWRAETLLNCIQRYEKPVWEALMAIADTWRSEQFAEVLNRIFPTLKKVSIDYAVMEPASYDPSVRVVAVPMQLNWLDVGSWPSFAETRPRDPRGNAVVAETQIFHETDNCLVVSNDPNHLVAAVGCKDLIVIHTEQATLVCQADAAESIKEVQKTIHQEFDGRYT